MSDIFQSEVETPDDLPEELEFELEIEGEPGVQTYKELEGGGVELFDPDEETQAVLAAANHDSNLAEVLDNEYLGTLASDILEQVEEDLNSIHEWEESTREGIKQLGLKMEEASQPFEGASNIKHPLLLENVIKFQSKAILELAPAGGPVKTKIIGQVSHAAMVQAQRVRNHMNYQYTEEMPEWYDATDKMLFYLGLMGSAFKKTFYDGYLNRVRTVFVNALDLIVDYHAESLETSRFTHRYKLSTVELKRYQIAKVLRNIDTGTPSSPPTTPLQDEIDDIEGRSPSSYVDEVHEIYEVYTFLDLEGFEHTDEFGAATGLPLPYVITIDVTSGEILAIRRNWIKDDPRYTRQMFLTHYKMLPGPGFYGLGYVHTLGPLARVVSASINSMIDAGTFANLPAGFKSKTFRITGKQGPLHPGEFREVNAAGQDLQAGLLPLPFKGADPTLMRLTDSVIAAGQKFADTTDQVVSDSTNYGPVGTTLALLDASGKLFSAIHQRLHRAQKAEFSVLQQLNRLYITEPIDFSMGGGAFTILPEDYDARVDVIPVSDPNTPSNAHRFARAQAILQASQADPQLYNRRNVHQYMLDQIDADISQAMLQPPPQQAQPMDPVTTVQAAMRGAPVGAFPQQNHEAHIAVYRSVLEDPSMGNSPYFNQQAKQTLVDLINQHLVLRLRSQVEQTLQQPLQGQSVPQVDAAVAQIVGDITGRNKAMAEAEMIKQQMANPDIQIKMQKAETDRLKAETAAAQQDRRLTLEEQKHLDNMRLKQDQLTQQYDMFEIKEENDLISDVLNIEAAQQSQSRSMFNA